MAEECEEKKEKTKEDKKLARLEVLITALMDAELDKKVIVFNFTANELEYINREWIVYNEG